MEGVLNQPLVEHSLLRLLNLNTKPEFSLGNQNSSSQLGKSFISHTLAYSLNSFLIFDFATHRLRIVTSLPLTLQLIPHIFLTAHPVRVRLSLKGFEGLPLKVQLNPRKFHQLIY